MPRNTGVFPVVPAAPTGQSRVAHAGLNVLTVDSRGFEDLYMERLGQRGESAAAGGGVPPPERVLGDLETRGDFSDRGGLPVPELHHGHSRQVAFWHARNAETNSTALQGARHYPLKAS